MTVFTVSVMEGLKSVSSPELPSGIGTMYVKAKSYFPLRPAGKLTGTSYSSAPAEFLTVESDEMAPQSIRAACPYCGVIGDGP